MLPEDYPQFFQGTTGFGLLSYSKNVTSSSFDDKYDISYACQEWSYDAASHFFDSAFEAARAFGIIANIASGITLVAALLMSCMSFSRALIRTFTGLSVLACISELLTFLVFASSVCETFTCKFSFSAGMAIGGSISAFITAIFFHGMPADGGGSFFTPGTGTSIFGGEPPGTVTVQETVDPDGTRTIVKTTVNADGSKTVEETIERPQAVTY